MSDFRRRRGFSARALRFIWRLARGVLVGFAAMGPAPPPRPQFRPDTIELREESGQRMNED